MKTFIADEPFRQNRTAMTIHTFLELVLIFLWGTLDRGAKFAKPGPVHNAHCLVKSVYSLHIFLFQKQFRQTAQEVTTICELSLFCSLVYCQFWFLVQTLKDALSQPAATAGAGCLLYHQ